MWYVIIQYGKQIERYNLNPQFFNRDNEENTDHLLGELAARAKSAANAGKMEIGMFEVEVYKDIKNSVPDDNFLLWTNYQSS